MSEAAPGRTGSGVGRGSHSVDKPAIRYGIPEESSTRPARRWLQSRGFRGAILDKSPVGRSMQTLRSARLAVALMAAIVLSGSEARAQPTFKEPVRYKPTRDERAAIEARLADLRAAIGALPKKEQAPQGDVLSDVLVYEKAADWALRLDEFFDKKDVAAILDVVERGRERARQLADGRQPWVTAAGSIARGYVSKVDGSVQPYAVAVPEGLDFNRADDRRARLDVVLHGRGATLNEIHFLRSHDGKPAPADGAGVVLHIFGRTNNAYRWAGETDVFEAIEAVKRNYPIDERRIVLRGFSMGGAGAWHLGLHYPSLWSSVEAGAGFSETKQYAKLKAIPQFEEQALHIYDAVDYAANAFNIPMAGYGGEDDPQRQASANIEEALKSLGYGMKTEGLTTRGEGIDFLRVVGKGMGHAVDPASAKILRAFHDEHAVGGVELTPKRLRFVTYTLKYNEAAWLTVEQLIAHYQRAAVEAEVRGNRAVISKADNVAVLGVERHVAETIQIGGQEFPLEGAVKGLLPNVYFRRNGQEWKQLDYDASRAFQENTERAKRHNLQGPIDDAFTGPFVCVSASGTPWNPAAQRWADARLARFAKDWRRWLRGEVRIKKDTEITAQDIEDNHLVLFGDPGSNRILAQLFHELPIDWSRTEIKLGNHRYPAAEHVPVMIAPNPLNSHRYVVVNSGHTFGTREFAGTNALLFPRLGDYALFDLNVEEGSPKLSGYFDERWKLKAD
jgi:dienelactone hydrolase